MEPAKITIKVRQTSDSIFNVTVDNTITVKDLKDEIEKSHNHKSTDQKIIFKG